MFAADDFIEFVTQLNSFNEAQYTFQGLEKFFADSVMQWK